MVENLDKALGIDMNIVSFFFENHIDELKQKRNYIGSRGKNKNPTAI